jgi:hypothetical protein
MRRIAFLSVLILAAAFYVFSQAGCGRAQGQAKSDKTTFLLLISEQNIEGPQRAWWMSEIDLSTVESMVAQKLISGGYEVLEPSVASKQVNINKAFKRADLPENDSVTLGRNLKADYVISGKAVASAGGTVPQSTMRSCYANVTAKLIRVSDGKVVAYLNAAGSTVHPDVITGGSEALRSAGEDLANKVISAMAQEGS